MMRADRYDIFKYVYDYDILKQRNYLTIFTNLKYEASI